MTFIQNLKTYAFGSRLKTLSDHLMNDVSRIYREFQIDFEPRWFPVFQLLLRNKAMSITQMANELNQSHPAVVQVINVLEKKELVSTSKDKTDKRKRLVSLSNKGRSLAEDLAPLWEDIHFVADETLNNSAPEFIPALRKLEDSISEKSMYLRIKEKYKQTIIKNLEFVEYQKKYHQEFKAINEAWLKSCLEISKHDRKILSDPQKQIIKKGGKIFILISSGKVVGSYVLQKLNKNNCELSKFAIKEEYRGWKLGELMLEHAISQAIVYGYDSILLFTHSTLKEAGNLYLKRGFETINNFPGFEDPTGRRSIIMQLSINQNE